MKPAQVREMIGKAAAGGASQFDLLVAVLEVDPNNVIKHAAGASGDNQVIRFGSSGFAQEGNPPGATPPNGINGSAGVKLTFDPDGVYLHQEVDAAINEILDSSVNGGQ